MRLRNINLNYLNKISDNNTDIIKEMIAIYIAGVSEALEKLNSAFNEQNWEVLRQVAHKNKSSVQIMGLAELSKILGELELVLSEKKDFSNVQNFVDMINTGMAASKIEAQEIVDNLKSIR